MIAAWLGHLVVVVLAIITGVGIVYQAAAVWAVRRFADRVGRPTAVPPVAGMGVTILKPVCGAEPGLYDNLRSFCAQDHAPLQIVIGVRDPADPAIGTIRRLIADLPGVAIDLIIDPTVHGDNLKVSNLINMAAAIRHDTIIVADSDVHLPAGAIARLMAPLDDPATGIVTCLYTGEPVAGLWSRLGALGIDAGFLPSVLVGRMLGNRNGCFGAVLALRRSMLDAVGGFRPLRNTLADDYALGAKIRATGRTIALAGLVVTTATAERSGAALLAHELRWARTVRTLAPRGLAASIVTYPSVTACLMLGAVLLTSGSGGAPVAFAVGAVAVRLFGAALILQALGRRRTTAWLVMLRDLLSFSVLIASFCGRTVLWRGRRFQVDAAGELISVGTVGHDEELVSTPPVV